MVEAEAVVPVQVQVVEAAVEAAVPVQVQVVAAAVAQVVRKV